MLLGIRSLLLIANTIVQSYRLPILQVTCDICFCLFFAVQVFLAQLHCPELTSKIRSSGPCRCNYTLSWSMDPRFSGRHIPLVFFSAHPFSVSRLRLRINYTAHILVKDAHPWGAFQFVRRLLAVDSWEATSPVSVDESDPGAR
jgi:hypothetical protein